MDKKRIEIFEGEPRHCEGAGDSTILLRERIAQLETKNGALMDALRNIAYTPTNWMSKNAVEDSERRMRQIAFDAYYKST